MLSPELRETKGKSSSKFPDFLTTVDLSIPYQDKKYQFIYGSQLYGTSFAVYANFNWNNRPDGVYITGVELKLVNYKGSVNLGFTGDNVIYWQKEQEPKNFTFSVKALSSKFENDRTYPDDLNFKIEDKEVLFFNRILTPYSEDSIVREEGLTNSSQASGFYDSEFNYRDGYFEAPNLRPEGHKTPPPPGYQEMPSLRCHRSKVRFRLCSKTQLVNH